MKAHPLLGFNFMALWNKCPKCGKLILEPEPHTCDEDKIEEMEEKAIRKKKKGRRHTGKYTGKGKYEERDW